MKLAILWLLLVAGALALISAVASYDPGHTDPSIVVVGERSEIAVDLPQLDDATFVSNLDDLPSPIPTVLLLTPGAASNLPDGALSVIAKKGVAIGGINVSIEELARLNGTAAGRQQFEDALIEAGEDLPLTPDPPFWSLLWRSCGIIPDRGFSPGGTKGASGSFNGPLELRPFETAFAQMKALGGQCTRFDSTNIPPPSYRIVVIGTEEEAGDFVIPALADAIYVDRASEVPNDDVALVLITPAGVRDGLPYEPVILETLRNSGVPIVGLDVDLASLMELSGVIAAIRGASAQAAHDYFASAQWEGERPVYSYISRSCPLDDPREGDQGQAWIGGLGAAPESPPLKTFRMRIEELREMGANCINILRRHQQAYIESLHVGE